MSVLVTVVAGLLVLGLPWAAASYWVARRVDGLQDRLEIVALGFGGFGALTWGVWVVARLFGLGPLTPVVASVVVATWLWLDARRVEPRPLPGPVGATRAVAAIAVAFVLLLVPTFASFGLERLGAVHTLAMTDWYKHLTVTAEMAGGGGFPPVNPYLRADLDPSYYFGFYVVAATLVRLAGSVGDGYLALLLLTFVVAGSVPLVLYALARPQCTERAAVLAAAACLLAGFDVLVVSVDVIRAASSLETWGGGFETVRALIPSTQLDYWIHHNERQFNPFFVATAWAPQHVAGALLALVVLTVVGPRTTDRATARSGVVLPALALAAIPAVSAYVALALAVGVTGAVALVGWRSGWSGLLAVLRRWVPVGGLGVILALPVLPVLLGDEGSATGLTVAVSASGGWSNGAVWSTLFGDRWWTGLLDTPVVYLVELGVVGLVAVIALAGRRPVATGHPLTREAVAIVIGIVLLITFFRPPVGEPNNLYARPMLLVFALLTPIAARVVAERRRRWHQVAVAVCGVGTAYALAGLVLQGMLFYSMPSSLAEACGWVSRETERAAPVAVRPDEFSRYVGFVCHRPLVVADRRHARLLGASDRLFDDSTSALERAYASRTSTEAAARFDALGATTVLRRVSREEPVPAWLRAPCFSVGHRNDEWLVAVRRRDACRRDGPGARADEVPRATGT